jgi:hypothetical protein
VNFVGIKKETARMHGVESFKKRNGNSRNAETAKNFSTTFVIEARRGAVG